MLRELLRARPAKMVGANVAKRLPGDSAAAICDFWPEGFLYVNYCVTIVRAILASDFDRTVALDPSFTDLRIWESFRENVGADAALAIPFFDLLVGGAPNWTSPTSFRQPGDDPQRRIVGRAGRGLTGRDRVQPPAAASSATRRATSLRASKCGMWPTPGNRCTPTTPGRPRGMARRDDLVVEAEHDFGGNSDAREVVAHRERLRAIGKQRGGDRAPAPRRC